MKKMKLPNGAGSISKLTGKRRNPYMVRAPGDRHILGYARTYKEAFEMLQQSDKSPINKEYSKITFYECYKLMLQHKVAYKGISENTIISYETMSKVVKEIWDLRVNQITSVKLQALIDGMTGSKETVKKAVNLIKQTYAYAMANQMVSKDPSERLEIPVSLPGTEHGVPFSSRDIEILWEHRGDKIVDAMILMCYTGFRISEYAGLNVDMEAMTLTGGVKTEAGKNRIVPIHPDIVPFLYALPIIKRGFSETMKRKLRKIGLNDNHSAHDCRHTFSWLCDVYGVDRLSKVLMLGHGLSNAGVTDSTYGHRTVIQLRMELEKIKVPLATGWQQID